MPPLPTRAQDLPRIVDEYAQDTIAALGAPATTLHGDPACTTKLVVIAIRDSFQVSGPSAVTGAWEARFGCDDKTIPPTTTCARQIGGRHSSPLSH